MEQMEQEELRPEPSWIDRRDGRRKLVASRDRITGRCVFPRVPEHSPAAPRYEPVTLSAYAQLYSFTIIHPNPKTGQSPFALAYADFPEGARVFGRLQLSEGMRPVIGTRLEAVVELSADGEVRYAFVPTREEIQ
jgi:uncharacterized OB-fold protein